MFCPLHENNTYNILIILIILNTYNIHYKMFERHRCTCRNKQTNDNLSVLLSAYKIIEMNVLIHKALQLRLCSPSKNQDKHLLVTRFQNCQCGLFTLKLDYKENTWFLPLKVIATLANLSIFRQIRFLALQKIHSDNVIQGGEACKKQLLEKLATKIVKVHKLSYSTNASVISQIFCDPWQKIWGCFGTLHFVLPR